MTTCARCLCSRRSSIPVITALLAIAVESKVPTRFEAAALGILVAGVMTAVWEGARGNVKGAPCTPADLSDSIHAASATGLAVSTRHHMLRKPVLLPQGGVHSPL
jgi:drug/metabolite transporter (DMT)-like permease